MNGRENSIPDIDTLEVELDFEERVIFEDMNETFQRYYEAEGGEDFDGNDTTEEMNYVLEEAQDTVDQWHRLAEEAISEEERNLYLTWADNLQADINEIKRKMDFSEEDLTEEEVDY